MKRYGLIGCGIGGSLSPAMFRVAYPGLEYDLIDTDDFEYAFKLFLDRYEAVNVTAPFKEAAFSRVSCCDGISRRIGAVNILVHRGDTVLGYNSDYLAVRRIIESSGDMIKFPTAVVIGCGGAGKAAAAAAFDCGLDTVVANRTVERAALFCSRFAGMRPAGLGDVPGMLGGAGVVIYTLPVFSPVAALVDALDGALRIEASYTNPSLSSPGCIGGRRWLANQAMAGFPLMTGMEPQQDAVCSVL